MAQVSLELDGKMGKKDVELFVAWLRQGLHAQIQQGLAVTTERVGRTTVVTLEAADEPLLEEAMEVFSAMSHESASG